MPDILYADAKSDFTCADDRSLSDRVGQGVDMPWTYLNCYVCPYKRTLGGDYETYAGHTGHISEQLKCPKSELNRIELQAHTNISIEKKYVQYVQ